MNRESSFDEYDWTEVLKRQRQFWFVLSFGYGSFLVVFTLIGSLLYWMKTPDSVRMILSEIFAGSWFVGSTIALLRWKAAKCPRCGKCFSSRHLYANVLTDRCLNCGLVIRSKNITGCADD